MTLEKYVSVELLPDDRFRVKIGNENVYVQQILPTEAHALHHIIQFAEPYSKMTYNNDRLEHVFNNALTHIWMEREEGEQYPLARVQGIVDAIQWHPTVHQRLKSTGSASYNTGSLERDRAQYEALGARNSRDSQGAPDTLEHLLDDMEYASPGITTEPMQLPLPFPKKYN